jgi:uncharacterized protein (DUF111 family)
MLVLLPRSGISGDMILSALIDLGADERKVASFLKRELSVKLRTRRVTNGGIAGRMLVLPELKKEYSPEEMKRIIEKSSLPPDAKKLALRALQTIVDAEKRMHGSEHVHFHELASVDTLVDIMGVAFALGLLGEKEAFILPLEVGRIQPAALDILTRHKVPFYSTTSSHELRNREAR